ncbi:folate-binding protein YgfZ [Pleurocapsa sp. CCALA 161]|uniref:CAF17-like 4Fe-4S cluster assembly/insertion protein YgfZ n=1 Tax=Pleurocapsa sp. CCALA 161 TaxID=2107688 RepID=UPI000D04D9CE|nr:folate-binding protein YgfZ [Pleurocapsa sp. CCALA 161]PSB07800.1 folate-binding protein YgfZ [Pleurocapsa sp. CCALA 161]
MELKQIQASAGAIFDNQGVVLGFGSDDQALAAIDNGVAIGDRSGWGLLKITGADRLRYLHNQSTNDFEKLKPGQGCDTVFVTSTARTLDLATAYVTEDSVLVLVSPHRQSQLMAWLDRFIFPFDKVELTDISENTAIFSVLGQQSTNLLSNLTSETILLTDAADNQLVTIAGVAVRVAQGSGLATPGYTLIMDLQAAGTVWSKLIAEGVVPFGDRLWESLRIQQGRPTPDRELTEDYNPLEAGLWQTISFEKGCYIGQETIARLNTYKGVKQKLWGIKLDRAVEPQTPITLEDSKIGVLTSYTDTPTGSFGLGYIRTKAGGVGLQVKVGEARGELISVPFLCHKQ